MNYYEILGISENAPPEVIKAAYKVLIQKHHPDKNPNDEMAEKITTAINTAYGVLSDPYKRRLYDKQIKQAKNQEQPHPTNKETPKPQEQTKKSTPPPPPEATQTNRTQVQYTQAYTPWRRYIAKSIDMSLIFYLTGFIYGYITKKNDGQSQIIIFLLANIVFILIEALFISQTSTTLGKWIMNLRVIKANGNKPTYTEAIDRGFTCMLYTAFSIPIIGAICYYWNYDIAKNNPEKIVWDRQSQTMVQTKPISGIKIVANVITLFLLLMPFSILQQINKTPPRTTQPVPKTTASSYTPPPITVQPSAPTQPIIPPMITPTVTEQPSAPTQPTIPPMITPTVTEQPQIQTQTKELAYNYKTCKQTLLDSAYYQTIKRLCDFPSSDTTDNGSQYFAQKYRNQKCTISEDEIQSIMLKEIVRINDIFRQLKYIKQTEFCGKEYDDYWQKLDQKLTEQNP